MTRKDEFIGRLETYLDEYEGVTPLPDAIRDAIRAELPRTRQVGRSRPLPRILSMTLQLPTPARYGLAATAVLAVVVIGASLFTRGGTVGGPSASPLPSATATSSDAAGAMDLLDSPRAGDLPAGDYYLDLPAYPARIDFAVPEGWFYHWTSASRAASDVHAILVNNGIGDGGSAWGLGFGVLNRVRVDPCDANAGYMEAAETESADAVATALATWPGFSVSEPESVTIGGYSGKRVSVAPAPTTTCAGQLLNTPTGYLFDIEPAGSEPFDNPIQFTFFDVAGSILLIWTTDYPGTNAYEQENGRALDPAAHVDDQQTLHEILDSIVFTPR